MALFPTLSRAASIDSSDPYLDDLQVDRATNGAPRIRAMFTAPKREFNVIFKGVTLTDWGTVDTFYTTNRLISFTFVWAGDGVTYTCYFAGPPVRKPMEGMKWEITLRFVQA